MVTTTNLGPNDSQVITPYKVYHCKNEKRMMIRSEVWKDHMGIYHCGYCASPVEDVTNTTTGKDFLKFY